MEGRKEGKEDRLIFLAQSGSEVFSHDYLLSEYLNVKSAAGPCESCPLLPVWLFPWTVCWKVGCPVSPTGFLLSSCLGLSFFQQNSLFHQLFCCHLLPVPVQPSNSELNLAHRPTSQPLAPVTPSTPAGVHVLCHIPPSPHPLHPRGPLSAYSHHDFSCNPISDKTP